MAEGIGIGVAGAGAAGERRTRFGRHALRAFDLAARIERHERMKARVGSPDPPCHRKPRDRLLQQHLLPERRRRAVLRPGVVVDQRRREQRNRRKDLRDGGGDRGARVRHQIERLEIADDDAPLVGDRPRTEGAWSARRAAPPAPRAAASGPARSSPAVGCASAARSVASSASPVGATAFGSVATAPTKARTTISGQWLTKRDSSVKPGDEVRDEPHDRQIGRAERVTVNVDRHRRQCRGRHRRGQNGRGEQWGGRRQRRRCALAIAAERRQAEGTGATDQEIATPHEAPLACRRPSGHSVHPVTGPACSRCRRW